MEQLNNNTEIVETIVNQSNRNDNIIVSSSKPFIEANTIEYSLEEIRNNHIIPVFLKDNEPLISHADFIESTMQVVADQFAGEQILMPNIRLSHPIKGRIPDAKDKPANELQDNEKTLHYERMAFVIDIPSVYDEIDGNRLSLTIGGVKSLTQDNLYNKKGADEHFKIFIGFKNTVCTNLCVWTDGFMSDLKVTSTGQLRGAMRSMIENYNALHHVYHLRQLSEYCLTEQQFALLMGRCRMYQYLPKSVQKEIAPLHMGDTQLGAVAKDYYKDQSFCKMENGTINLWRVYNLFTGANKTSYIDNFLDRSVNAFNFCEQLKKALKGDVNSWFLN